MHRRPRRWGEEEAERLKDEKRREKGEEDGKDESVQLDEVEEEWSG